MPAKRFDRCLKNLLTISGVTCEELALYLDVTVPVVRRWMSGVSAPDIYQFREIARFFGLPYEWFLDGGDGFPDVEDLSELLGLNVDTLEGLMLLAETEDENVLGLLDDTVYSVVSALLNVMKDEDWEHPAEEPADVMECSGISANNAVISTDSTFDADTLAVTLGLSTETVETLKNLVDEGGNEAVLEAVDNSVGALLSVIDGVFEDLDRYAKSVIENKNRAK